MDIPPCESFDVFLSHSHADAEIVESIATKLEDEAGFRVWLDKWVLVPGAHWQQEMTRGLEQAKTCAVCIGQSTPAGWFREEIEKALNRQTKDKSFRVIPVILPGGNQALVDSFLELRTWVIFKNGIQDTSAFHVLVSGINGRPPGRKISLDRLKTHRENLDDIKKLRAEQLIDNEIALEYQRKILDQLIKL